MSAGCYVGFAGEMAAPGPVHIRWARMPSSAATWVAFSNARARHDLPHAPPLPQARPTTPHVSSTALPNGLPDLMETREERQRVLRDPRTDGYRRVRADPRPFPAGMAELWFLPWRMNGVKRSDPCRRGCQFSAAGAAGASVSRGAPVGESPYDRATGPHGTETDPLCYDWDAFSEGSRDARLS